MVINLTCCDNAVMDDVMMGSMVADSRSDMTKAFTLGAGSTKKSLNNKKKEEGRKNKRGKR
jgi:hypothetical protein